ncbi:nuclear pore complex protein [Striga asiatica]|uniref:Nuclear pore complex protein n=1 Tax=Striga asiatica TaxID=4170 RepID=A0A5A7PCT2_STRAF|nr:nuclear pore complex protein [Striga asiatica]
MYKSPVKFGCIEILEIGGQTNPGGGVSPQVASTDSASGRKILRFRSLSLIVVQRQSAASSSSRPCSTGQHMFSSGFPIPTCISPPRTSRQSPSFRASIGHVAAGGGPGTGRPPPPGDGGGHVTGGGRTGGGRIMGGTMTGGLTTGGEILGGGLTMGGETLGGGLTTGGEILGGGLTTGGETLGVGGLTIGWWCLGGRDGG